MLHCFFCKIPFDSLKNLRRHVIYIHDVHSIKRFHCRQGPPPSCNRTYDTLDALYKHIRKEHINDSESDLEMHRDDNVLNNDSKCSINNDGDTDMLDEDSTGDIAFDIHELHCRIYIKLVFAT